MKDCCVLIGRFNPFHLGHAYVLEHALKNYKLVIVLVGSAGKSRSPKNPFLYAERKEMIEKWERGIKHDSTLRILPVRDFASNNTWIKSVQATVRAMVRTVALQQGTILNEVYITGSDRDVTTWYLRAFPQWKQDLVPAKQHNPGEFDDLSATSVRKFLYEGDLVVEGGRFVLDEAAFNALTTKLPPSTIRFMETFFQVQPEVLSKLRIEHAAIKNNKAKWSGSPHPPTFMCADAVIIQSGHVLMIHRANQPGRGLWALPGGYVKVHQRVRDAAIDEALEETGIRLTTGKNAEEITKRMLDGAIRDKEFFDDPNRSERGRTFTMAYLIRLDDTRPLPFVSGQKVPYCEWADKGLTEDSGDEAIETFEAEWKTLEWVFENSEEIFEDHTQIIEWASAQIDD